MSQLEDYTLLVDPQSPPPEIWAAKMLQDDLRKAGLRQLRLIEAASPTDPRTTAPLAPCLFVGNGRFLTDAPELAAIELADEEVLIRKDSGNVFILGGGSRGTLYAVVTFLERFLGYRFFAEDLERIPSPLPALPEQIDYRDKPAFEFRDCTGLWLVNGDWAVKSRINGLFANTVSIQGGRRDVFPRFHSFRPLVPADKYFRPHPEYFALIGGQRTPKQLCLSNPKVQELATRQVLKWIRENPEIDVFSVTENDGGGACECPNCRALDQDEPDAAGQYFRFVNKVARAVRERHPQKWIEAYAYGMVSEPPRGFALEPNILVKICRDWMVRPEREKDLRERIVPAWRKAAAKVYIWYYAHVADYMLLFPILEAVRKAVRDYHRIGVDGMFIQSRDNDGGGFEDCKLDTYVIAKLLWDPEADVKRHVSDFMDAYYGPAAEDMKACLHKTYGLMEETGYRFPWTADADTFAFLRRIRDLCRPELDRAQQRCRRGIYATRVKNALLPFLYADVLGEIKPRIDRNHAVACDVADKKTLRRFMRALDKAGVLFVRGGVPIKTLAAAVKPMPVKRLENDRLSVAVLPQLGGRLLQVREKTTGAEVIPVRVSPSVLSFLYSGWQNHAGKVFNGPGSAVEYETVSASRTHVELTVPLPKNGSAIRKSYSVRDHRLEVDISRDNQSNYEWPTAFFALCRLAFDDNGRCEFGERSGAARVMAFRDVAAGQEIDLGQAAEYRVFLPSIGLCLEYRFQDTPPETFVLQRILDRLDISFYSTAQTLKPGDTGHYRYTVSVSPCQT